MKDRHGYPLGLGAFCVSLMLGVFASGCSSPKSVGVEIGERNKPDYRVAHKRPGPPSHAPAHGYRRKFGYEYYPSCNVYYDRSRKVYFYMSGNNWKVGVSLPSTFRIDVNEAVSLELSTDTPYLENEEHVKMVKYKHKAKGPKQGKHPWKHK